MRDQPIGLGDGIAAACCSWTRAIALLVVRAQLAGEIGRESPPRRRAVIRSRAMVRSPDGEGWSGLFNGA